MKIEVVREVSMPKLYARPKELAQIFGMGLTATREVIDEMRASLIFKEFVIVRPKMILVKIEAFERFLKIS